MYDFQITGMQKEDLKDFCIDDKTLSIQGKHANEGEAKQNVFVVTPKDENPIDCLVTVIPKEKLEGLEDFTISYLARTYKPTQGSFGLVLFYDNVLTDNEIEYFNGYDNYTFTGYKGARLNSYDTYSVYSGTKVEFAEQDMLTKRTKDNQSLYTKVRCTKGDYEYEGKHYTARILSYVDNQLVATSYAQWKDAPVMFRYEFSGKKNSVQFTRLELNKYKEDLQPPEPSAEPTPVPSAAPTPMPTHEPYPTMVPEPAEIPESGADVTVRVMHQSNVLYEKFNVDKSQLQTYFEALKAGNDTAHTYNGKSPLNNVYDAQIMGNEGVQNFDNFGLGRKALVLLGNHSTETSTDNLFILTPKQGESGESLVTVIPQEKMNGLEEFSISWVTRVYRPEENSSFGLILFYDNAEVDTDGISYFNGFNNYTFSGYQGNLLNAYSTYSVYEGERVDFATEEMMTKHTTNAKGDANNSIHSMVKCTKGNYEYDGKQYTAKILSYVDDQLVSTSYAQWKDAPVMFHYKFDSTSNTYFSVQFTRLQLDRIAEEDVLVNEVFAQNPPLKVVSVSPFAGDQQGTLRFCTELKKEVVLDKSAATEVGVIMIEKEKYHGQLDISTEGIVKSNNVQVASESNDAVTYYVDFDKNDVAGKQFAFARAYVKYTIEDKEVYYYTDPEPASVERAAIVTGKQNAELKGACDVIASAYELKLMSFNMLTSASKTAEKYGNIVLTRKQRMEAAVRMILDLQPDVIGLMEVSDEQRVSMENNPDLAGYSLVGSASETSLHEQGLYVMYQNTQFLLEEWGIKYLSETPDIPHSYVEEALVDNANGADVHQPRKAVYVVLKDKETGQRFAYVATHLDHTPSGSTSEVSNSIRRKQAQILVDLIREGKMFDPNLPFAICGDMNSQPNLDPYQEYIKVTDDSRFASPIHPDISQGTLHSYAESVGTASNIDYIFVSRHDFYCERFDIITQEYRSDSLDMDILPSDHYAVTADVTILP